ncbi:MAG TPA: RnfABCDGE type electron transport complex subunit D [Bacteroidales bacterium]|nr:RnfABCDGE type electron transport complex subunit D [Bacteroidales bacterium]
MALLTVSGSPHVQSKQTTKSIMWTVVIALLPALLVGVYYFGLPALVVTLTSVFLCVLFEWLIQKFVLKVTPTIKDGSAVITGVLLAFNLPASVPLWILAIGALVAIGVAKMSYGGLGKNPFNPALVGRVFLFISFPAKVAMSDWPIPKALFSSSNLTDAVTGPTPLLAFKNGQAADLFNMFIGNIGGSLGEVSALALIIGGLILLFRKVITWHIPVSFLLSAAAFALVLWLVDPSQYMNPAYHMLAGGMMLGAIFMATDMVTSPITYKGQLIFGFGCGVLTIIFRSFGPMPEGVSFAILIMNAVTPLINKGFKPKPFGY